MKNVDKIFIKNFIWNLIGTSFNSFTSLFLLIIVTRINGIQIAGIYAIGAAIAVILYTIGDYSGRICQVTETQNKFSDKDYFVNRLIASSLIIIITIIILLIRKYDIYKSLIVLFLCMYRALEAFSEVLYGILQKNDKLYKAGQSYTIKAVLGVLIFAVVDLITKNLVYSCFALVLVYVFIIAFFDFFNIKEYCIFKTKTNFNNVKLIFKKEFFVFANSFAGVYILNAQKYALDVHFSDSIQAVFGYIMMPASIINLFTKFVIMPYLKKFTEYLEKNTWDLLKKMVAKIKLVIIVFGFFCISLGYVIGPEVLEFIYQTNLEMYRVNLCIILFSYILFSISYLDLIVLTTFRNTLVQFVIYLVTMIIAFITSSFLVQNYEILGATISCFITLGFLFVAYSIVLKIAFYRLIEKPN